MRTWRFAVVVACGSAPPAPVHNDTPRPTYSCGIAAAATVRDNPSLDRDQRAHATADLEAACTKEQWDDRYVRCKSAGDAMCVDSRTEPQRLHERRIITLATMPPDCITYVRAVEVLGRCATMAKEAASLSQTVDVMLDASASWTALSPADKQQAMVATAQGCRAIYDAIEQALRAAGC
jgi:hypothetical protein